AGNVSPAVEAGVADLTPPAQPSITDNNGQGLSGTGEPGGLVTLHKPDGSSVTTNVDQNGNWAFTPNPLGDGEKGSVTVTDVAGNVSPAVEAGVADLTPPAQPSITGNNSQGLSGTGEPGGLVTLHKPDGSSVTT
ncbi:hypothetical protein KZ863_31700, partial [Pseudomonas aeruginosa]